MAELQIGSRVGAGRYEVRARLGAGGMGVVYEVLDRASDEPIALKTLRAGDPQLIKREFRALADVMHPNLVQLYDLFDDDGQLCLTMELVPGVDLVTELCGAAVSGVTATLTSLDSAAATNGTAIPAARDLPRVRERFAQLARGLHALHRRGVVHRDIKPHNVRITPEGRVVLLDFGLATLAGAVAPLAGTVAYMAPEQADEAPVSPAADWYSFGVLLHEVLAGRVPWTGPPSEILRRKRQHDPPPLAVAEDLATLVADLVRRDPAVRPGGGAVLDRLGQRARPRGGHDAERVDEIVGRRAELAQLAAAWVNVVAGGSAWLAIEGRSGVGKTTLVTALATTIDAPTLLHGRCYEREAVAYKGIDEIVDAAVDRLMPALCAEVAELVHAFPSTRALAPADLVALPAARVGHDRRGAALRTLLARLAPVLIVIDDIQWADGDCLALLAHALAPPGIPGAMVVVAARPDPASPWLELPMPFTRMRVGELADADAIELAQRLLGRAAVSIDGAALARQAGGHPLDLIERVRAALVGGHAAATSHELLLRRVADAPVDVRTVVELAAIAGAPVPVAAIATAGGLGEPALRAALDRAQLAGLVRSRRAQSRLLVEPAHDQVREVVFAALSPMERAQRAATLAPILERMHHEAAQVADLYVLACLPDEARRCAERAAEQMAALGGHEAAAGLWRQVAGLATGDARRTAQHRAADALALAGRGSEAAAIYQVLAHDAPTTAERLCQLRRAGEELLRAGRFDEGLALLETNLHGWRDPRNPAVALARGLAMHAATRAGLLPGTKASVAPADLEMVELRWAALTGYTLGSPGHFMLAVENYLRAALALGDPERISLAWSAEATLATFMGSRRFGERCLERAAAAIAGVDAPRARVVAIATAGLHRLDEGAWTRAAALVGEALELADRAAPNVVWERHTAGVSTAIAAFHRGDLATLARDMRRDRDRVAARGDLYAHELVHSGFYVVGDLLGDEASRATDTLAALASRPTGVMTAWLRAIAHALVGSYGHRADWHRARADQLLAGPLAMPLLGGALVRGTLQWTRASLELARGHDRRRFARWLDALRGNRIRGLRACADLLAGHAASLDGDRATAARLGAIAELAFAAEDMPAFAASARLLVDPGSWPAWRDALAQAGAVRPERVAMLFAPSLR